MAEYKEHVIRALRGFLDALKTEPGGVRHLLTLVQFAGQAETCAVAQPLEQVPIDYRPDGDGTALRDAAAYTLDLEKSQRDPVICLFVTDGEDNCSEYVNEKQLKAKIQTRREWGNWTFLCLNLGGKPNKTMMAMGIECVNVAREKISEALPALGQKISQATARLGNTRRILIGGGR
jgi:hypothetical protein